MTNTSDGCDTNSVLASRIMFAFVLVSPSSKQTLFVS